MRELAALFLLAVVLAWCADHIAVRPLNGQSWRREVFFSLVLFVLLAGFVGLRKWYNDTDTYRHSYELLSPYPAYWDQVKLKLGNNFGFWMINAGLKTLNVISQDFLMFWALVVVGLYVFFLHQHSSDYAASVFLLIAAGAYLFACAAIKQTAAVAFCLMGTHCFLKKKYLPFVLCVLFASTVHPYALLYLLVPLFTYKPWTRKTYLFVSLFIAVGFMLQPLLGTIVNVTTMIGEEYTVSELSREGVNFFRVLVCNVPLFLSFVYRKRMFEDSSKAENLFVNLSMLNGAIMFVGLFGTANYFARLANYFLVFQTLALPWMIRRIKGWDHTFILIMMILGYSAYFYYSNGINQPWDEVFYRYSIMEYLSMPR